MQSSTTTMPSAAAPVAVVDALNSLLESCQNSIFRFMGEGSPYLSRATVEVRRPLQQMVDTTNRQCAELHALIESLGGDPRRRGLEPEEQYLAFLSLKFLLPKLADAKRLTIQRYENTIKSIGGKAVADVTGVLERHLGEHRAELSVLEKATQQVLAAAREPQQQAKA
jgi:hypothetical protein